MQHMIGVFDSGVGGLSVLRAIRRELPQAHLLYAADSRHAPYGDRDSAYVIERTHVIAQFLLSQGAQALVVACNTATVMATRQLRQWCYVPVVGIEPGIKPAAALTRRGAIGVLATSNTVGSDAVATLRERYGQGIRVVLQACPGLAEQVERGTRDDAATHALLDRYLAPLQAAGVDVVVLGCTHYAFLADVIRARMGSAVDVIEPSAAVARELSRRLGAPTDTGGPPGGETFFSNAAHMLEVAPETVAACFERLWGQPVTVHAFNC